MRESRSASSHPASGGQPVSRPRRSSERPISLNLAVTRTGNAMEESDEVIIRRIIKGAIPPRDVAMQFCLTTVKSLRSHLRTELGTSTNMAHKKDCSRIKKCGTCGESCAVELRHCPRCARSLANWTAANEREYQGGLKCPISQD